MFTVAPFAGEESVTLTRLIAVVTLLATVNVQFATAQALLVAFVVWEQYVFHTYVPLLKPVTLTVETVVELASVTLLLTFALQMLLTFTYTLQFAVELEGPVTLYLNVVVLELTVVVFVGLERLTFTGTLTGETLSLNAVSAIAWFQSMSLQLTLNP